MRGGAWVLLDELNLAGQTVLEGLNAVLDHRAEVGGGSRGLRRGSAQPPRPPPLLKQLAEAVLAGAGGPDWPPAGAP